MPDGSVYMNGNLKNYIDNLAGDLPPQIISPATYQKISEMASLFSDFAASEYIMETHLNSDMAEVDFSWRVLTIEKERLNNGFKNEHFSFLTKNNIWAKIIEFISFWDHSINDIWFEMDYDELDKLVPIPCFFFNAIHIKKGREVRDDLLYKELMSLLDKERLEALWLKLQLIIHQLPNQAGLFQVGVMLARHSDRVRIFTAELTREQLLEYLIDIAWTGSFSQLQELFELVHPYSDGKYILDFDVSKEGVSEKIGINFGLNTNGILPDFLEMLISTSLCTDRKKQGVAAWSGSKGVFLGSDYGYTALIQDISHFKISLSPDTGLSAKAYLRVAGVYMKELFKNQSLDSSVSIPEDIKSNLMSYKELQVLLKDLILKAVLNPDFRELCLIDSQAAIQEVLKQDRAIPMPITFIEDDNDNGYNDNAYILPPFIKKSWLLSK